MTEVPSEAPAPETRPPSRGRWLAAGIAAIVIAAGAVYGIVGPAGNAPLTSASPCAPAAATAERIKPQIHGEVAGLVPSAAPLSLSQLSFNRDDGSKATLADWSGRTVLLNLWATWCGPCRAEMPALDKLQASLGAKDFEVVTVDVDTTGTEKPKKFLAEIGVQSLTFHNDPTLGIFKALQKTGRSRGLPTTILIDGKGCEIGTMYGPANWDHPDAHKLIEAALGRT